MVDKLDYNDVVQQNTLLMASHVGQCLQVMIGQPCSVDDASYRRNHCVYNGIVVIVPFSGLAQGHYVMELDVSAAETLLRLHLTGSASPDLTVSLQDTQDFSQEILNVATGYAVVDLEQTFGDLSYFSSLWVCGQIIFPPVLSGAVSIATPAGMLTCGVLLDLVKPKVMQKLSSLSHRLIQKTNEASIDGLTKVFNRSYFEENLKISIDNARANGTPLGLIMIDVDHFKTINDTYGHQCGDDILRAIAEVLRNAVSAEDIPTRYGGDEFIIILPGRTELECVSIAQSIGESMKKLVRSWSMEKSLENLKVSVSLGVTNLKPDDSNHEFMARVDKMLYSAKQKGRNTFVVG